LIIPPRQPTTPLQTSEKEYNEMTPEQAIQEMENAIKVIDKIKQIYINLEKENRLKYCPDFRISIDALTKAKKAIDSCSKDVYAIDQYIHNQK
jgi:hypothetical protein